MFAERKRCVCVCMYVGARIGKANAYGVGLNDTKADKQTLKLVLSMSFSAVSLHRCQNALVGRAAPIGSLYIFIHFMCLYIL